MGYCVVPICKSDSRLNNVSFVSFHEFPVNNQMREAWIRAICRKDPQTNELWQPSDNSKVCSLHFEDSCFSRSTKYRRLLPGSIPTVFPGYPKYFRKIKKETLYSSNKKKIVNNKTVASVNVNRAESNILCNAKILCNNVDIKFEENVSNTKLNGNINLSEASTYCVITPIVKNYCKKSVSSLNFNQIKKLESSKRQIRNVNGAESNILSNARILCDNVDIKLEENVSNTKLDSNINLSKASTSCVVTSIVKNCKKSVPSLNFYQFKELRKKLESSKRQIRRLKAKLRKLEEEKIL